MDEGVISSLCDNHHRANRAFDGPTLQLLRDFTDTGGGLHQA